MIAAIALANDLPVYTCNPDDFRGIESLEVAAVPVPESEVKRGRAALPCALRIFHRRCDLL
jgi:hypothetical protein